MKINGVTVLSALATTTNYVLKQSSTAGTLINSQIFDNGTNVGIGTTTPQNKFHAYGSDIIVGNDLFYAGRFSNNSNKAVVIGYDSVNNKGHIGSVSPGVAWTDLILNANGGKVGIGTSAPNDILSVQSNVFTSLGIYDTFNNSLVRNWAFRNSAFGADGFGGIGLFQSNTQNGDPNSGTVRFGIDKDGNVGIGTSAPDSSALLELKSTTKGFLPPRMRTSERDNIGSPANGLTIFNTDSETIDVFTNGGGWKSLLF